jgi:hypothetical protein
MWVLSPISERQIKVLDKFLDWFEDNLTSRKCAANAKCSADSALSDKMILLLGTLFVSVSWVVKARPSVG